MIFGLSGKPVDSFQHLRLGILRPRTLQCNQCVIPLPALELKLRKFQQCLGQRRKLDAGCAHFTEHLRHDVVTSCASFAAGKIPLCQRPPRLLLLAQPPAQSIARWLSLCAIQLIELRKNRGQLRIVRVMIDKIFQEIVAFARRLPLEVCIGDRE